MPDIIENHGVLHGRYETDYLAGVNSPIGYEVLLPNYNWNPYAPTGERQSALNIGGTDKMECVTQSLQNVIEFIFIFYIMTGRMPAPHLKFLKERGYFDANNKVNFNERIAATLNETMPEGNYLSKVADKAREYGLFPHGLLPDDKKLSWAQYYDRSKITPAMLEIGKEFKKYFNILTEWIPVTKESFLYHLKQSPIQVVFPNHAVAGIFSEADVLEYFDSYTHDFNPNDWTEKKAISKFTSAMKITIEFKQVKEFTRMFRVFQGGKAGLMIVEDQVISVQFEDDYPEYLAWLKAMKAENAPIVNIPLGNFFRVNDKGTLGLLVVKGYAGSGLFEDKWPEYQTLLSISGAAPAVPMIDLPIN